MNLPSFKDTHVQSNLLLLLENICSVHQMTLQLGNGTQMENVWQFYNVNYLYATFCSQWRPLCIDWMGIEIEENEFKWRFTPTIWRAGNRGNQQCNCVERSFVYWYQCQH